MAGSDSTRVQTVGGGPAIVLVKPQLAENIGAAARAMLNGGLRDLRIVAPREPFPSPRAYASASGADEVIAGARLFVSVEEAIADLRRVYATTARPRDMSKPVVTPREAAAEMRATGSSQGCGVLFGPERTGLANEHVVLADAVLTVPLNPAYASLNLAQAVMLVAYEWYQSGLSSLPPATAGRARRPATRRELQDLFQHLERELDAARFLLPVQKRPAMVRNLRNIFTRKGLTEQEVRTLRGVVTALAGRPWRDLGKPPEAATSERRRNEPANDAED